ncbi:PREDICTED: glutathione S-transferase T3-like [Brassica oleracea var. oleracea]|uniref:glutathione S-transferase T3-like n=1 Tax=Brassica oleracea var. oleracea TaxID=109376 RepID=UPI0006A70F7C|nr:PREDICTED: glutathione S-transferase T3-like [Brassica oleracea var. oleracea]
MLVNGYKFTLDHCWRELRYDQKWSSTYVAKDGGKEKRRSQVPDESPSQVPEESGVKERRKYSPKEDKILIGAWLNTCKDPVVGNEQKAGAFWKRIVKYYNASPHLVGQIPREITSCKQRWARINERPTNLNNMFSNRNDLRDSRSFEVHGGRLFMEK